MQPLLPAEFPGFTRFGVNCTDICFLNIVNYFYGEYYLGLLKSFDFQYFQDITGYDNLIGVRLYMPSDSIIPLCKEYYGVFEHEIPLEGKEPLALLEQNLEKGDFCIVESSLHLCKWCKDYQRIEIKHFFIILGTNDTDIIFVDPWNSGDIRTMPKKEINSVVLKLYRVVCRERREVSLTRIIRDSIEHLQGLDLQKNFDAFISDMSIKEDLQEEFKNIREHYWMSNLDRALQYFLSGSRESYAFFLRQLYTKTQLEPLLILADEFDELLLSWRIVRTSVLKAQFSNQYKKDKQKILRSINQIKQIEISLQNRTIACLESYKNY